MKSFLLHSGLLLESGYECLSQKLHVWVSWIADADSTPEHFWASLIHRNILLCELSPSWCVVLLSIGHLGLFSFHSPGHSHTTLAHQGSPGSDWTQLLVVSYPVDQTTKQVQSKAIGWSSSWLTRLVAPSPVGHSPPCILWQYISCTGFTWPLVWTSSTVHFPWHQFGPCSMSEGAEGYITNKSLLIREQDH